MGVSERDDLLGVRRVGKDFLITRQRRVEDYFAGRYPFGANAGTAEHASIGQYEQGGFSGLADQVLSPRFLGTKSDPSCKVTH
jgi:hypothetical protein